MSWFKQTLANIAGTQEPVYGPSAIQPCTKQATAYTELTPETLRWATPGGTCVETQTIYIQTDDGTTCMAQVIYSSVMGVHTTAQFNTKIFDHSGPGQHQWLSDPVADYKVTDSKTGFQATNLTLELNEAGDSYTCHSAVSQENEVSFTLTRACPGFVAGEDGTSHYGTDPAHPWGSMRHAFWPRCTVSGSMKTKTKTYNLAGRGVFIHALQGMKPHHAAARWNFVNLQTPTYSAVMMEFITPPSYGKTVVNVACIAKDGQLLIAGPVGSATHLAATTDPVSKWPEPKAILATWKGQTKDGQAVDAEMQGDLILTDRVDVLAHVPGLIKNIIGGVAGTKPIIFQYASTDAMSLHLKEGESSVEEKGKLFMEATFIS